MAEYEVNLSSDQVKGLLTSDEGLKGLVEAVVNQVLDSQMSEHLTAGHYERSSERKGYRNGYRTRAIYARIGKLVLRVPQSRDGEFSTDLFSRYQRSEQALVLAMMEMVLQGVSTRRVEKVTEELCGESFSKSTVSRLCTNLDARVGAWNERRLDDRLFPFLIVDALVIKVRTDGRVVPMSGLIASGINRDGNREILGMMLGNSETESTWASLFGWLKERGLKGVDLVVSDDHKGLKKAAARNFQGATWQRCQVHLMRNVLGSASNRYRGILAAGMKRIFGSEDRAEARTRFRQLADELDGKADKALEVLENGFEDALAVMVLPEKYRRRLATTNMQERLNEEIRRRERVIRIFPNEASAMRLIGALLAEKHEVWSTGKKYFDMQEYFEWRADQPQMADTKVRSIK
ncbi:MAG TPA: IS256 family transposase [Mariprofundaceae bacterium]|nr:IS256 family transposase [Mariprofundaceae bacterium]